MIGFIIWVIGVVLAVKAVLEIMRWPVDGVKKLLVAIIILLTSCGLESVFTTSGEGKTCLKY